MTTVTLRRTHSGHGAGLGRALSDQASKRSQAPSA